MSDEVTLKPLMTNEEIDAAYPEHAKARKFHKEIDALRNFFHGLEYTREPKYQLFRVTGYTPSGRPRISGLDLNAIDKLIFAKYGIDVDKWWAEKRDMLEQLSARNL